MGNSGEMTVEHYYRSVTWNMTGQQNYR